MLERTDKDAFRQEYKVHFDPKKLRSINPLMATEEKETFLSQLSTHNACSKYLLMVRHSCSIIGKCAFTIYALTVVFIRVNATGGRR